MMTPRVYGRAILASLVGTGLLCGCSLLGPTESDLRSAMEDYMTAQLKSSGKDSMFGSILISAMGMDTFEIHQFEKISCEPESHKAAKCEVFIDFTLGKAGPSVGALFGIDGRHKGTEKHRFVKIADGWIVSD
jgi:hypothetical protein